MNYDVNTTDQSFSTSVASINTRNICFSPDHHDVYPTIDFPEEFRIDTKPFIDRPFFVENFVWGNQPIYTILPTLTRELPRDVFTSNLSLENALKLGAYFRSDLTLSFSVSGTITHAGTLLVGIMPPVPPDFYSIIDPADSVHLVNSLMSGPHCFLHANEATSAMIHVPWFCNTDVASLDMRPLAPSTTNACAESNKPGNFASLVVMVLNPLSPSEGSSTTLNLTVEATFNAMDIFVPSPRYISYTTQGLTEICDDVCEETTQLLCPLGLDFYTQGLQSIASSAIDATTSYTKKMVGDAIDEVRAGIKYYTGLHNPNIPLINNRVITSFRNYGNNTTGEQFFEKLDPYPEIDRIVDRPIFNTAVDEMSIKHILSKPQYIGKFKVNVDDLAGKLVWANAISPRQGGFSNSNWIIANNIELIHYLSRAWRGSIKIHIQSVMNNKQQVKLRLIQLYNPPSAVFSSYPEYSSILSGPSHLMEFTAGGEVQTITLPYLCRNSLTPCSPDLSLDAIFHGMYYIYVAQSMANSTDSPVDVNFNVFISAGDDLTFHGYATELATQIPLSRNGPSANTLKILKVLKEDTKLENEFITQGLQVMNEPQTNSVLEGSSTDIDIKENHQERLFSPIDIRPLIRRMYQNHTLRIEEGENVIDLKEYIGEKMTSRAITPLQMVAGMYYGKSAGLKIKIRTVDFSPDDDSSLTVFYVPPQCNISSDGFLRESTISTRDEFSPLLYGGAGYPVPFLEIAHQSRGPKLYEFVVPNTNLYKFIGGPEKFNDFSNSNLSIASFGTLLIYTTTATKINLFIGMTDESRLGFHSIAPIIRPTTDLIGGNNTLYKGSNGGTSSSSPSTVQSPYIKYARN